MLCQRLVPLLRPTPWVPLGLRTKIVVDESALTKRVCRSSGPGGQSVNTADTRVQMSFRLDKADWIPEKVRKKMFEIHKNRISKIGEFSVSCQQTSSQIDNQRIAIKKIGELIAQAEKDVRSDDWEENEKLDFKDFVVQKFK
ncbi:unnamed protein product, partial [Effrenium voratum]